MTALLSLISPRVVFYGILASLLLAFGIHYKHLENEVQRTAVVAKAAQDDVKKVDATAQSTETQSVLLYKAVLIPAVGDIGISCVRHTTGGSPLPATNTIAGTPVGSTTPNSAVGPEYDPTGAALTRAKAADAQIAYLQRRVKELETQMNGAP